MIETYKLMTGKYDHTIFDFMPKQHDSGTHLPTTISLVFKTQTTGTVSQTMLCKHQTSRHLKLDWTSIGRSMKGNTNSEAPTALLLTIKFRSKCRGSCIRGGNID